MRPSARLVLVLAGLLAGAAPLAAQSGYQLPPRPVVNLVDAPPTPSVSFSPDGAWMLFVERDALPPLEDVARPMLRLAGRRIDPACDAPYVTSHSTGLRLRPTTGSAETRLPLPEGARVADLSWSHTSTHMAYTLATDTGTELWVVDVPAFVADGTPPTRLTERLLTVLTGFDWMPDGRRIAALVVPDARGEAPSAPRAPAGPNVLETAGLTSPVRTYQDLLTSAHDAALFRHHATGQIRLFDVAGGGSRDVGRPAVYMSVSPAPDGRRLLTTRLKGPYPLTVPYYQFARTTEVLSLAGAVEHVVADLPVDENVPIGGVHTGRRRIGWRAGKPATLVWSEALDGGDPKREVPARDRWLSLDAPFDGEPAELLRTEHRASGLTWTSDPERVLSAEYDRDARWTRTQLHDLSDPAAEPVTVEDRSVRDRYGDPGRPWMTPDASGSWVVELQGDWMHRMGSGASPEGLLPFLDRQDARTGASERLWRCSPGAYESVTRLGRGGAFVTRHETPTSPPNYRLHVPGRSDGPRPLTRFKDPQPALRRVHKELVTYERADGVPLSATLYLPPDHQEGQTHPLLVWAYPREFNDAATAGQVGVSPSRFTSVRGSSHLALLLQGYAVLDGATMPIIGDAETMNDSFIEQLVLSAEAAIDFAVERGIADRDRVAIGGHSYGAFMTANLLAHSDLFAAGIARSGAYNRTLTPFGFQSERRTVWEATDSYVAISPFLHANKIDEPMLMIHGEVDNNSGTYPIQSQRMYAALKGNGGTARLVMLPHESHGYRARESVLHVQHEMGAWLDQHVRGVSE